MLVLPFSGRALLVLGAFALSVHSFVPAAPTNDTTDWKPELQALLDVFWYPDGSTNPLTLQSLAVASNDPIYADVRRLSLVLTEPECRASTTGRSDAFLR